ncbi:response regulator [Oryzobacter terrae]|uniref:response regulator n=1 Tax=Oryzobacter terrae TaxID=1620385 RepID=UPI0036707653
MARTVLLVDDHPGFRRMARLLLQSGGFDVVGEAASLAQALERARELEPDLVLLDVLLPDGNGADLADVLAGLPHPPGVVLTSSDENGGLGPRLATVPVLGFVAKDELTVARLVELFG